MAVWQTPKTNWVASDYFNVEDWNRIIGNIEYIKELCAELYPDFVIAAVPYKGHEDFPYARELNDIENNLQAINNNTYPLNLGDKKTWQANRAAPSYEDFNRWENAIMKLGTSLKAQMETLPRLSFVLGQGGLQV